MMSALAVRRASWIRSVLSGPEDPALSPHLRHKTHGDPGYVPGRDRNLVHKDGNFRQVDFGASNVVCVLPLITLRTIRPKASATGLTAGATVWSPRRFTKADYEWATIGQPNMPYVGTETDPRRIAQDVLFGMATSESMDKRLTVRGIGVRMPSGEEVRFLRKLGTDVLEELPSPKASLRIVVPTPRIVVPNPIGTVTP